MAPYWARFSTLAPCTLPTENPGTSENSEQNGVALGAQVSECTDRLSKEGVDKEGLELNDTWIRIPDWQLKTDYNHLAEKYCEGRLSMEDHINEDIARPCGRYASPRQERIAQYSNTDHHARL